MTDNRLIVALLGLTITLQAGMLYQQRRPPSRPAAEPPVSAAPDETFIDIADMPSLGAATADVVLIEFSDYECPFCQRHAATVLGDLKSQFVDTGGVRYVFANNPLPMHPNATFMATAAICAGRQDRYWEMHDVLFDTQPTTREAMLASASTLALELAPFEQCLDEPSVTSVIHRDLELARQLGVSATPGFGLGRPGPDGSVAVTTLIRGAQPLEVFETAIDDVRNE